MNDKMLDIMQRRGELCARISAQRGQLAQVSARFEKPLAIVDQGVNGVRYLRRHPLLVAGIVAIFAIRRGGVVGLVKQGFKLWRAYRSLSSFADKLNAK